VDGRRDQVASLLPPTQGIACRSIPNDQELSDFIEKNDMALQREPDGAILETHVTITILEYNELLAESRMLAALIAQGVDQWDGYDRAREELGLSEASAQPF
jgi:hypothetical protein